MKEKIIDRVKTLLQDGSIEGFLGLREQNGHILPHLFTKLEELAELSLGDDEKPGDARYPLNKVLMGLAKAYPDAKFGVLVRGCDERGLVELIKWSQLDGQRVVRVGLACPEELAGACSCEKPYPDECIAGDKVGGASASAEMERIAALPIEERFGFWMGHFDRCVKCYGCRNVCPMCFCKECSLDESELIQKATLPTENPIFHLTRAVHMVGRCIDCGLCEEACPADIPLRTLYKKVAEIVESDTGYRPGKSPEEKCPFNVYGGAQE